MYRSEMTSPLSERNWDQSEVFRDGRPEVSSENDLLLKMQKKMTGLDSKQKKVIKEYESELDAMRNEIKKIKSSYDHLKQKNVRYRHHLKEKTDMVKKLQEEQARMAKTHSTETSWSSEKTKLLAKLKQLEVEKKQVEDQYRALLNVKDDNVKLKSEVESLRFKETLWQQEKEKMERKRRQNPVKDIHRPVDRGPTKEMGGSMNSSFGFGLNSSEFNFDDAWNHITNSTHLTSTPDKPFSSLPSQYGNTASSSSYSSRAAKDPHHAGKDGRGNSARHTLRRTRSDFQESSDLQDIRKSLNEAREELMRSSSNIDIELESARSARQAKSDSQTKKDQFLQELKAREEMELVQGMTHQRDADANEVRSMICSMEAKIASLETNCLSEVQNLVSNVDILKNELLSTQQELQFLKEYSKTAERQREQEKIQLMNESRELKLDLSSLRTEIRDKSEASDRTDQSRSVFSDSREQEENFEKHYSPLVGFVGSRCDYLKMKLDTLKKHLKNLDLQTKTVLNQSLTSSDDGQQQQPAEKPRKISKSKAPTSATTPTSSKRMKKSGRSSGGGSGGGSGRVGSSRSNNNNDNNASDRRGGSGMDNESNGAKPGDRHLRTTNTPNNNKNNDDANNNHNDDDNSTDDYRMDFLDDDEIVVVTPRPHVNKYDQDMNFLIVENGQNIERLRLPSLEEEGDEEEEDDDDDDDEVTMENTDDGDDDDNDDKMSTGRGALSARSEVGTPRGGQNRRVMESPRLSDRSSARMDEDEVVSKYLVNEETRSSTLANQVDSRFERLERELARHERRRNSKGPPPLQADHKLFSNSNKH